jgi:hypothetical protein
MCAMTTPTKAVVAVKSFVGIGFVVMGSLYVSVEVDL